MKHKFILSTIVLHVLLLGMISVHQGLSNKDIPTKELVENYLNAEKATMVKGATKGDIDRLLTLCMDEVIYEHVRFAAQVTGKKRIEEGMLLHLDDYEGSEQDTRFEVINIILGYKIVVVEYRQLFKANDNGKIQDIDRRKLTILEFDGSKICRIADYE